jgi:3-polyprenyl-4-hydroxybenzoate decarboxylase
MPLQLNVIIAFASATSLSITTTLVPPIVILYQTNQTRQDLARFYLNRLITLITATQMLGQRFVTNTCLHQGFE